MRKDREYIYTGGTFALYSLLCRHSNLSHLPNQQDVDEELSTYKVDLPPQGKRAQILKSFLEKHTYLRTVLLLVVLLGTCMVIGDGVLTPAISGETFYSLFSGPNAILLSKL